MTLRVIVRNGLILSAAAGQARLPPSWAIDGIFRRRWNIRRTVQKATQIALPARLQEGVGRLCGPDLLRHRRNDPLIKRHAILPGKANRGLLERLWQLQRVFVALSLFHVFSLPMISAGVAMVTPSPRAG